MQRNIRLEIHFYSRREASVSIITNATGLMDKFGKLLLFTGLSLRQLHNLGRIEPTESLANKLVSMGNIHDSEMTSVSNQVDIVDPKDHPGDKQFIVTLIFDDDKASLLLDHKGFGVLGEGVNYFAPQSAFILFRFLTKSYASNDTFLRALAIAASSCGTAYHKNAISLYNQQRLTLDITKTAIAQAYNRGSSIDTYPQLPRTDEYPISRLPSSRSLRDASGSFCESCGIPAPTKYVEFYENVGALVMRFHRSAKGNLCKPCINKYFWDFTGKTMLLGWWGIISFIVTPLILINNTLRFIGSIGLKKPRQQIPGGPSSFWVLTALAGYILLGLFLFSFLAVSSEASINQSTSIESCALKLVNLDTYLIFNGKDVKQICDSAIKQYPDYYSIAYGSPRTPIICREEIDGVEAIVVDTDDAGSGGSQMCRSLYEMMDEK
jgi:hypothetical protein